MAVFRSASYLKFATAALLSMLAGAQIVHSIYKPLDDLEKLADKELEKLQQSGK